MEFNKARGEMIAKRRRELGLSVADLSHKCGIAEKTWYRYEAGNAIRDDKVQIVLSALKWSEFPSEDLSVLSIVGNVDLSHWAYVNWIADKYDVLLAKMFACACDLVFNNLCSVVHDLSSMPKGSHVGQVFFAYDDILPECYLTRYDYEFMCRLCDEFKGFIGEIKHDVIRRTVVHELLLAMVESEFYLYVDMFREENIEIPFDLEYFDMFDNCFDDKGFLMYFGDNSTSFPDGNGFLCARMRGILWDGDSVFSFENWFRGF